MPESPTVWGGMPWQVRGVYWLGFPAAIAVALIIFMTTILYSYDKATADNLMKVDSKIEALSKDMNKLDVLIRIQRQTCINTAPDTASRLKCSE